MNQRKRRAIIVLGVHRSGTSALAGVLGLLGARLPARMAPAMFDNPTGYFEPEHIVAIHDRALAAAGTAWWGWEKIPEAWFLSEPSRLFVDELVEAIGEDYAAAPLFVVKDPRMCRLMPLWYRVLDRIDVEPCFAIPLRNPVEVAKSLQIRDGLPLAHGCLLWLRHVLDAERDTRGHPRVFLRYPDLLAAPHSAINRMGAGLGLAWPRPAKNSLGEIKEFLDPRLRNQIAHEREIADMGEFSPWLRQAYDCHEALVRSPADTAARRRLDGLRTAFAASDAAFTPVFKHQAEQHKTELAALRETLAVQQSDIATFSRALAERENQIALGASNEQDKARFEMRTSQLEAQLEIRRDEISRLAIALESTKTERTQLEAGLETALTEKEQLAAELDHARKQIGEMHAHVAQCEAELAAIRTNASWRLTVPLRSMGSRFPATVRAIAIVAKFAWFAITLRLPSAIIRSMRQSRDHNKLSALGGVRADWYLAQYPDVRLTGMHPIEHYVAYGASEGRDPNPMFDTDWYLAQNPDVHGSVINPLVHYLEHGAAEGRDPSPLFDTDWYLATNPDVAQAGVNPLLHYLDYGASEGRAPHPMQSTQKLPMRSAGSKYDVIILANIEWTARWQRPQQLAQQFARNGHRVFYVVAHPNIPDGTPRCYDATPVADGIFQVRLSQSAFFNHYATIINGRPLETALASIDELVDDFDIVDAVIHVHLASWTELAIALRERWLWRVIYDCMDEWDTFPNLGADVLTAEKKLVTKADAVIVTGALLQQKWASCARRCELVRNGVDFAFFQERCKPNERSSFRRPVVGYYGAVAEWVDLDLIAALAKRNPAWHFVIAGDDSVSDLRGLDRLPNVDLLGLRPHDEMPELLWHFDVCLVPFKLSAMTHAVDPLKLYEYLSDGKPVVSVPLMEIKDYGGVITFADGPDGFGRAIAAALSDKDATLAAKRRLIAEHNQWSDRYQTLETLTRTLFPFVSIVVVTYNNCDLTRLCIDSIIAHTTHPAYEIIVVDNNSSDDTKVYLSDLERRHANIKAILNSDNRGFAAATNQGLSAARGDVLIILNNDVCVPRGWLRGMLRCLDDPGIGLVGPVTNFVGNEARVAVSYQTLDDMHEFARGFMRARRGVSFDIAVLAMYCLAMRRDTFEKIGLLDEDFVVGMFEDDDYANRARKAGYRVVCTEESFVHHAGQAAFSALIKTGEYQMVWQRNQAYYESKWGNWVPHKHRAT